MTNVKFLDLFAGIGGFRLGMESAAINVLVFVRLTSLLEKAIKRYTIRREK